MAQDAVRQTSGDTGKTRVKRYWRDRFIEFLAQSSNVSQSAAQAGVSTSLAYQTRRQEPEFANRWMAALNEGYIHLEMEVLRRLREGDQTTGDSSKYDFANAIRLLNAHRENAAQAQASERNVSAAEIRASIDRKIEEIRKRLQTEPQPKVTALNEPLDWLASARSSVSKEIAESLTEPERAEFQFHWPFCARGNQLAPPGDWRVWLILAGRGFGKTRAGAEWVRAVAESEPTARIALVAASLAEARSIMVEGESGIIACCPPERRPIFEASNRRLRFPNGACAQLFSAAEPELLRGPQHSHAFVTSSRRVLYQ